MGSCGRGEAGSCGRRRGVAVVEGRWVGVVEGRWVYSCGRGEVSIAVVEGGG